MSHTEKPKAVIAKWDQARTYVMAEGEYVGIVTSAAETGGAFVISNGILGPGSDVPNHYHKWEDQTFHIIEGTLTATIGDETVEIGPGDSVYCPRGVPHYMKNTGDVTAKMISYIYPGDKAEAFMAETSRQLTTGAFDLTKIEEEFGVVYL